MSEYIKPYPDQVTFGSKGRLLPHSYYKSGDPLYTHHLLQEPMLTRSFLLGYADKETVENAFDKKGRLKFRSKLNPYKLHGKNISEAMGTILTPWYELVQGSYVKGHDGDFNNHLVPHVQRVGSLAVHVLKNCVPNVSRTTIDNTYITALLHDMGGVEDRREHANIAPHLAKDIFPALKNNTQRFLEISNAIIQHDEGYFRKLKGYGYQPFDKRANILRATQTPLSAAILISDKSDVGRERVHRGSRRKNSMLNHIHSEVNMYTGDLGLSVSDDAITWTVAFNPLLHKDEYEINEDLCIEKLDGEYKDYYLGYSSPRIRNNPEDPYDGISYEKVWNEVCHIYGPQQVGAPNRLQIMVDSAITHFRPNFNIVYYNPFNHNEYMSTQLNAQNVDSYFEQMSFNNMELNKNTQEQKAMGVI